VEVVAWDGDGGGEGGGRRAASTSSASVNSEAGADSAADGDGDRDGDGRWVNWKPDKGATAFLPTSTVAGGEDTFPVGLSIDVRTPASAVVSKSGGAAPLPPSPTARVLSSRHVLTVIYLVDEQAGGALPLPPLVADAPPTPTLAAAVPLPDVDGGGGGLPLPSLPRRRPSPGTAASAAAAAAVAAAPLPSSDESDCGSVHGASPPPAAKRAPSSSLSVPGGGRFGASLGRAGGAPPAGGFRAGEPAVAILSHLFV